MPRTDSRIGRRKPPLDFARDLRVETVDPDGIKVYAATTYMVFIERMWHGEYQQVPVDPQNIPDLIAALERAMQHANRDEPEGAHDATP